MSNQPAHRGLGARRRLASAALALACLVSGMPAASAAPESTSDPVVVRARTLANDGRYEEARTLLVAWLEKHPTDFTARFLLARVLYWEGRYEPSLEAYERLLKAAPRDADYMLGEARVLLALGRRDDAIALLERARNTAPWYADVWQVELQALDAAGQPLAAAAARLRAQGAARFPGAAWLAPPTPPDAPRAWLVEGDAGGSYLTNGFAPWAEAGVIVTRTFAPHQAGVLTARDTLRFGVHDQELGLAWYQPVAGPVAVDVEGTFSPGHQVLPAWAAAVAAYSALPVGFEAALEVRETAYTEASTTRETLVVGKYLGPWRLAYTLSLSQLPGAPNALGQAGTVEWNYGEANREALTTSFGREMEFVAPGRLLQSDVTGIALTGRTWLVRGWGISHGVELFVQGTSYVRAAAHLGVLAAF